MALLEPALIGLFNNRPPEISDDMVGPVGSPQGSGGVQPPSGLTVSFPYSDLIRDHLSRGRIAAARNLFEFARDLIPPDSGLARALAPPKIKKSARRGQDRSAEFQWLDANSEKYRGQWVALLGGDLMASATSLKELLTDLGTHPPKGRPLIHHLD